MVQQRAERCRCPDRRNLSWRNLYFRLCDRTFGATLQMDSSSLVPFERNRLMSNLPKPRPGQRWRSLVDGHTVITGDRASDGTFWVQFDNTHFATAMDPADFFDGYEFVESVRQPVASA